MFICILPNNLQECSTFLTLGDPQYCLLYLHLVCLEHVTFSGFSVMEKAQRTVDSYIRMHEG